MHLVLALLRYWGPFVTTQMRPQDQVEGHSGPDLLSLQENWPGFYSWGFYFSLTSQEIIIIISVQIVTPHYMSGGVIDLVLMFGLPGKSTDN